VKETAMAKDDDERKRVLQDGEVLRDGQVVRLSMMFMDHMRGDPPPAQQPRLHRPGFAVIGDAERKLSHARQATHDHLLSERWRRPSVVQDAAVAQGATAGHGPRRAAFTAPAKPAADIAQLYRDRDKRLCERWKLAGAA